MEKSVVILFCCVILMKFISILTYEDTDCKELKENETPPRECCEFPILYVNHTTLKKCFRRCPSLKSDDKYKNDEEKQKDECCLVRCFHEVEEVLDKKGSSELENLKYSFRTRNGSVLSNEWQKVVDKAVDNCGNKTEASEQVENCLPVHHTNILKCSYVSLFLNCVNFNQTENCLGLKRNVNSCENSQFMTFEAWSIFFA